MAAGSNWQLINFNEALWALKSLVVPWNLWLILSSKILKFSDLLKHTSINFPEILKFQICAYFFYCLSGCLVISNFEDFFAQTMDKLKLTAQFLYEIFVWKSMGKFIFKNKQLFCLSREKAMFKHVDDIDAWWQKLQIRFILMRLCHPPDVSTSPKYKLLCFKQT